MYNEKITLTLPLFDRNHGDHKFLNEEFIKVWEEVPVVLSTVTFETKIGIITINIDWENFYIPKIKEKLMNYYTLEDYINGKIPKDYIIDEEKFIDISLKINIENYRLNLDEERVNRAVLYYVDNIFCQIFLAMNLSTPGSFSCFSYELKDKSNFDIYSFTSSEFESAWINSINIGYPTIERIELEKTWNWLKNLNLGSRQIAENSTERALFSILTISKDRVVTTDQLIWNTLALEALYKSPKVQITSVLINRISRILSIPEKSKKIFNKRFRDYYAIRSRFVHGKLNILHPLANNVLDERIFDCDGALIDHFGFGFCIVVSTLQKMIKNNWKTLI